MTQSKPNPTYANTGRHHPIRRHGGGLRFFRAFLRQPVRIGAVTPSSRRLARLIARDIGLEDAGTVVELGAGTGVFTREIRSRMKPEAFLMAVEIDPGLSEFLRRRFPGLCVVNSSAENLGPLLQDRDCEAADCIVSGLPWAGFGARLQERLLNAVVANLSPGGKFTTFAYCHTAWMPRAVRFRRLLEEHFAETQRTRVVWGNLPPAFVYRCVK